MRCIARYACTDIVHTLIDAMLVYEKTSSRLALVDVYGVRFTRRDVDARSR